MPCYHPISGYITKGTTKSFSIHQPRNGKPFFAQTIPCNQCIGCRLERSRQWAMRCMHESQLHKQSCFITLTYNQDNVPTDGSLNKRHFQLFIKRLRKNLKGRKIRYYHCGEYGESFGRPHYHACLFGYDPEDKQLIKNTNGIRLYSSPELETLWGLGFVTIGEVTFESAAYVARYITKKITGNQAENHYQGRNPEYTTMSRRPGIGKKWFDQYQTDIYPKDFITVREQKVKPPKYYDQLNNEKNPHQQISVKENRRLKGKTQALDNTPERLQVKEQHKTITLTQLKRSYENGT
ncbi:MAG: replication initiator protein [Microvirus sp.]|nr:MAG: replication initiator protein [Microvirus sp.]